MKSREDFVRVRLTPAGEALGAVGVYGSTYNYDFTPGTEIEMPAGEFQARLAGERNAAGEPLFELVTDPFVPQSGTQDKEE